MAQRLLNVRVRPSRVTILLDRAAGSTELTLAVEFLSRIWGGRFGQIFAVDAKMSDELTMFRLAESRPDFVYGIGLEDDHWTEAVRKACQPRRYRKLRQESIQEIDHPLGEEHLLANDALIHLFRTRSIHPSQRRMLRLVTTDRQSSWAAYCAAMFGMHHPNLRSEYFDESTAFIANTATELVELAKQFATKWQQSWLDVTGHGLTPRVSSVSFLAPTVILVESTVSDLALFWNLRTCTDAHPAWIIPVPVEEACIPATLQKLREWLLSFMRPGVKSNYCVVTSQSAPEAVCQRFAKAFLECLTGSVVTAVDYEPATNRVPIVTPYEYETAWPVDLSGRVLSFQPPRPKAIENIRSRAWFIDLAKDLKTRRAIGELQLPPGSAVFEVLNGPCPPTFEHSHIARTGDGTECINVRCSGRDEVVRVYLPTSVEILEEILREHGVGPQADEKRSAYLPVIKRFGGLFLAASAFCGQSGSILSLLANGTKTLDEIAGTCRLGAGQLSGDSYMQEVERIFEGEAERTKRISRRRFLEYSRHSTPEHLRLLPLLEHWANRKIVARHWRVGPCGDCGQPDFVSTLRLARPILCATCGHGISLPSSVPIGYALHRSVRHAVRQGIASVVLAGRFLQNMAHDGFLWLPGVKYRADGQEGDIDILASCDGALVFCECKRLSGISTEAPVWARIVDRFAELVRIAEACNGDLVVLASQIDSYPQGVEERIKSELKGRLPYLLLNSHDLESGYRNVDGGDRLRLHDLIRTPFPERQPPVTGEPRRVEIGSAIYGRGW